MGLIMDKNFKGLSAVAKWLKNKRYAAPGQRKPIGKTKVYEDAKRGAFVFNDPGAITPEEVLSYCHAAGLVRTERENPTAADDLHARRTAAQARMLEAKARRAEHDLAVAEGKYLPKDQARLEFAIKIATFEANFKTLIRVNAEHWITQTGGDPGRARMLCEMAYADVDRLLHEMGNLQELGVRIVKRGHPLPWDLEGEDSQEAGQ